MVDWDELEDIRDWNFGWRAALDTGLSERYVPGEGDNPRVFIVGEAPGAQEDVAQRPFVGPAGRVLRDLMASCGIFTGETPHFGVPNCWLTNVIHFRPPGNRTPTQAEISVARMGLRDEWTAVGRPRIIVPVGGTALTAIMGERLSILHMSGKYILKDSRDGKQKLFVWPMIHPSAGLKNNALIPHIEKDWSRLDGWLKRTGMLE